METPRPRTRRLRRRQWYVTDELETSDTWTNLEWYSYVCTHRFLEGLREKRKRQKALKSTHHSQAHDQRSKSPAKPIKPVLCSNHKLRGQLKQHKVIQSPDSSSEDEEIAVDQTKRMQQNDSKKTLRLPMSSCESPIKQLLVLSSSDSSASDHDEPSSEGTCIKTRKRTLSVPTSSSSPGFRVGKQSQSLSNPKKHAYPKSTNKQTKHKQRTKNLLSSNQPEYVSMPRQTSRPKPTAAKDPRMSDSHRMKKEKRYVLFVGNIPYTASTEDVVSHFVRRGVPVKAVRIATFKTTGGSRGFGFVEFGSAKALQVCVYSTS